MTVSLRKRVLIAGVFIFILAIIFAVKAPQLRPQKKINPDNITNYLQDGDIICRLGDRLWSRYFKDISPVDKRFSHLGIVRIIDNKITIIHAEGRTIEGKDSVNEVELKEFIDIARAIGVYRLKDFDGEKISKTAMDYIGFPFDWSFDMTKEGSLYCTELLYVVLKEIAPEIQLKTIYQKEIKKDIIPLEAVSASEHFDEVLFLSL